MTMRARNGSAAMRTATSALRREVDALDGQMKEDIANMKHELVPLQPICSHCLTGPLFTPESKWT